MEREKEEEEGRTMHTKQKKKYFSKFQTRSNKTSLKLMQCFTYNILA